jgi:hypothetical protein
MASVGAGHGNPLSTLSKNVETSHHRSKVSQLSSSGQHWPLLGPFLLAPIFPVIYRGLAKGQLLSCLTPTLYLSFSSTVACPLPSALGPLPYLMVTSPPLVCPSFTCTDRFLYNQQSFRMRLIHNPDDARNTHIRKRCLLQWDYMALYPRRLSHLRDALCCLWGIYWILKYYLDAL